MTNGWLGQAKPVARGRQVAQVPDSKKDAQQVEIKMAINLAHTTNYNYEFDLAQRGHIVAVVTLVNERSPAWARLDLESFLSPADWGVPSSGSCVDRSRLPSRKSEFDKITAATGSSGMNSSIARGAAHSESAIVSDFDYKSAVRSILPRLAATTDESDKLRRLSDDPQVLSGNPVWLA